MTRLEEFFKVARRHLHIRPVNNSRRRTQCSKGRGADTQRNRHLTLRSRPLIHNKVGIQCSKEAIQQLNRVPTLLSKQLDMLHRPPTLLNSRLDTLRPTLLNSSTRTRARRAVIQLSKVPQEDSTHTIRRAKTNPRTVWFAEKLWSMHLQLLSLSLTFSNKILTVDEHCVVLFVSWLIRWWTFWYFIFVSIVFRNLSVRICAIDDQICCRLFMIDTWRFRITTCHLYS